MAQQCFNPRARVGRDLLDIVASITPSSFNPRARVGRDAGNPRRSQGGRGFNPRARVGRDGRYLVMIQTNFEFQSTRPRGARLSGMLNHP